MLKLIHKLCLFELKNVQVCHAVCPYLEVEVQSPSCICLTLHQIVIQPRIWSPRFASTWQQRARGLTRSLSLHDVDPMDGDKAL